MDNSSRQTSEVNSKQLTKQNLRLKALLLVERLCLDQASLNEKQSQLTQHLSGFLQTQRGYWGGFRPLKKEASPLEAMNLCSHIHWAYPRTSQNQLEFYLNPQAWKLGAHKIEEPDPDSSEFVALQNLDGFLIPGVAFDEEGHRLGRGLGFFDRALKDVPGLKVGVAWDCQMMKDTLPTESFDVSMDVIITNQGIVFNSLNKNERRLQK